MLVVGLFADPEFLTRPHVEIHDVLFSNLIRVNQGDGLRHRDLFFCHFPTFFLANLEPVDAIDVSINICKDKLARLLLAFFRGCTTANSRQRLSVSTSFRLWREFKLFGLASREADHSLVVSLRDSPCCGVPRWEHLHLMRLD